MLNTKIRLIIFFAGKDGETLHSQQKQDWELTVAQIMNPLLQNENENVSRSVVSDSASVHGILQVRIVEWAVISFSRGSSQPRSRTQGSCTEGRFFTD